MSDAAVMSTEQELEVQFIAHLAADLVMERSIEPERIRRLLDLYAARDPVIGEEMYAEGYDEGLEEGTEDNKAQFDAGYQEGYEEGLEIGKEHGFDEGVASCMP